MGQAADVLLHEPSGFRCCGAIRSGRDGGLSFHAGVFSSCDSVPFSAPLNPLYRVQYGVLRAPHTAEAGSSEGRASLSPEAPLGSQAYTPV